MTPNELLEVLRERLGRSSNVLAIDCLDLLSSLDVSASEGLTIVVTLADPEGEHKDSPMVRRVSSIGPADTADQSQVVPRSLERLAYSPRIDLRRLRSELRDWLRSYRPSSKPGPITFIEELPER